jgi:uncharacterized protein YbjT (DUF2867 family)
MNVLLTGATGVAGAGALRECLADAGVARVTTLTRRPVGVTAPKLQSLVLDSFLDYAPVRDALAGHDACLWCLGISQRRVTVAELEVITVDFAVAAAKAMAAANPRLVFCFLSGRGADSSERSRIPFARLKGRAENALLKLDLPGGVYCFRPGFIQPDVPFGRMRWEDRLGTIVAPLLRRVSANFMISTADLARGMLRAARHGAPSHILENADIVKLVRSGL